MSLTKKQSEAWWREAELEYLEDMAELEEEIQEGETDDALYEFKRLQKEEKD